MIKNRIKALLFAGTTEGRLVAKYLVRKGIETHCCVATKGGEEALMANSLLHISVKRLDIEEMKALIASFSPDLIIDATHPYAVEVSNNIYKAANVMQREIIRVIRSDRETVGYDKAFYFDGVDELVRWLNSSKMCELKIFSTLGAKEAKNLADVHNYKERILLRILPADESRTLVTSAGFEEKNIVAAMPPFSVNDNIEMFRGSQILLTKDTGSAGGFGEKIEAAMKLGLMIGIIRRPLENSEVRKMDIHEIEEYIQGLGD